MATRRLLRGEDPESENPPEGSVLSYAARLIVQNNFRFFTFAIPSDVLADTCTVEPRYTDPLEGFQRKLDERRAQEIADYINAGFGTIPTSIVLSAQPGAELEYNSKTQVLKFKKAKGAFLILDGQHRVYGFKLAQKSLRVPVIVYNNLSRSQEARLFIDINTKQRPVPNELLLDIKRLANDEDDQLALMRDVFDRLNSDPESPLLGRMSAAERVRGKISRVTFNTALTGIGSALGDADADYVYGVLSPYLHVWLEVLRENESESNLTNSTLFRAIILLFPRIMERVTLRHGSGQGAFTRDNFAEAMEPMFRKARNKKQKLKTPGNSPLALHDYFKDALEGSFSLSRTS